MVFYRTMILDEEFENGKKLFVVDIWHTNFNFSAVSIAPVNGNFK